MYERCARRLAAGVVIGCVVVAGLGVSVAPAHEGMHDDPVQMFIEPALASAGENRVEIVERDGFRHITSNGLPNHETGTFPNRRNPNTIRAQEYAFRVTLTPKANDKPTNFRHQLFGVAVNGVVFDPGTAEFWNNDRSSGWNYEALTGPIDLGIDRSKAHVQPNGAYHYHGVPVGLVAKLAPEISGDERADRGAVKDVKRSMLLLGYAADGFPIYGPWAHADANDAKSELREMKSSYRLKKGTRPGGDDGPGGKYDGSYTADFEYAKGSGDLDDCNGRTGVTPEYPSGTYYYVVTNDFPFIPRTWRGTPDESFMRKGGPGGGGPGGRGPGGRGGPDGPPPPGRGDDRRGPPPGPPPL